MTPAAPTPIVRTVSTVEAGCRAARHPLPSAFCRLAVAIAVAAIVGAWTTPARSQLSPGPLAKAHAAIDSCFKCHGTGDDSLDRQCLECHREIAGLIEAGRGLHALEGEADCAGCHPDHGGRDFELVEWSGGGPESFDHDRAGWSLEGKHRTLRCAQCHRKELQVGAITDRMERRHPDRSWLGLERDCLSCHPDQHRGTLEADCTTCHTQRAWKPASGFDHARSAFPLDGKHVEVACEKCHLRPGKVSLTLADGREVARYKPVSHQECASCHRDPHTGQLGARCSSCHVTSTFARVNREAFDHARTRYPLRGRHRTVACASCHDPVKAWGKKPASRTCDACHTDPHAGTATLAGKRVDCASCHSVQGFKPATYSVAMHASSGYPLEGKHRQVACDRCHPKIPAGVPAPPLGRAGVLMRPPHRRCGDCHREAHGSQFAGRPDGGACESCHRVDGWKPSTYAVATHGETRLPLAGRHVQIECAACHGPVRASLPPLPGPEFLGSARVALTGLDPRCATCHLDPHEGEFSAGAARAKSAGCVACHGWRSFVPATVDPASHGESAYPLRGGHRTVPCVACHEELKQPPGRIRLLQAEGETRSLRFARRHDRCDACHRQAHGEQFDDRPGGGECGQCHGVDAFRPATEFDHEVDTPFPLRGAHDDVRCEGCHPTASGTDGAALTLYRPVTHRCRDCHGKDGLGEPTRSRATGIGTAAAGGAP